jgi:hypothetical protein
MPRAVFFGLINTAAAFDNHDFKFWNTEALEWQFKGPNRLVYDQEFRFGDNAGSLYYQHYDLGYLWDLNKFVSLGLGWRFINEKVNDKFRDESEPYLMAYLYAQSAGFKFINRSRLEYRYFDYRANSWRYRNKLDIKFPWEFTRFKIQPYIADEVFVRFNGLDANQNRLYGGLGFVLTKNLKGELFYMWQTTKNYPKTTASYWTDINVLGTKFKYTFGICLK